MSKTTDLATIAVVALLGAGGFLIYKNRNEIGNFFGGIGKGAQDFADGIGKGVGDFTDGVGKWYGDTIEGIQKGVDDVGKNVGGFFDGVVKGATGVIQDIQGSYVNFFGGIGKGLQDTVTGIQGGVDDFTKNAGDFFGGIAQGFTDFISGKRVTEDAPTTTTKAPEETKTPIMQGSPSSQDLSKYKVKNKSLYDRIYGEGNYTVIGAPLTKEAQEEKKKNPVVKPFSELAKEDTFIGRILRTITKN